MFDFGSSAFNIGLQGIQDDRARKWEVNQTDKQYERDIEQRDYSNWYNSPENQMKRFEEAGLNPNLIYGQGTAGNQSGTPKAGKASGRFTPPQMAEINGLDMIQKFANIKKTNQETELTSENVNFQKLSNSVMEGTYQAQIDLKKAQLTAQLARTKNDIERNAILKQINSLNVEKLKMDKIKSGWMEEGFTPNDSSAIRILWQQGKEFKENFIDKKNFYKKN